MDEKLSFLREHPVVAPNLLVVGSSVAWRHFDGAAVASASQAVRPLNGAFCGLHISQSSYVADWLLGRHSSVRQVVMIVAPNDFTRCQGRAEAVFDKGDVDDFVYGGASRWPYYLHYFSPVSFMRNAWSVKAQRANLIEKNNLLVRDALVFDRFGDGPLDTQSSHATLRYRLPEGFDPACFDALEALAERLQREGKGFLVVSSPLHPLWKVREDPDGIFLAEFDRRIRSSLQASGAHYWDADSEWTAAPASFTDAIHMRWSAAQDFSAVLAQHIKPVGSVATLEPRPEEVPSASR